MKCAFLSWSQVTPGVQNGRSFGWATPLGSLSFFLFFLSWNQAWKCHPDTLKRFLPFSGKQFKYIFHLLSQFHSKGNKSVSEFFFRKNFLHYFDCEIAFQKLRNLKYYRALFSALIRSYYNSSLDNKHALNERYLHKSKVFPLPDIRLSFFLRASSASKANHFCGPCSQSPASHPASLGLGLGEREPLNPAVSFLCQSLLWQRSFPLRKVWHCSKINHGRRSCLVENQRLYSKWLPRRHRDVWRSHHGRPHHSVPDEHFLTDQTYLNRNHGCLYAVFVSMDPEKVQGRKWEN